MQINRLMEMVYILLEKRTITARELAERFEVSQRTIYRDVEVLSAAGIPLYANKGKGGGICIMENYVVDKSLLSDKEQRDILASLQGMKALQLPDVEKILDKLGAVFKKDNHSWIEVDFSNWGSSEDDKKCFNILKSGIIDKRTVSFDYFGNSSNKSHRIVEPLKLIFKGQAWYFYGYCRLKSDYRLFKLTRIKKPVLENEVFCRVIPDILPENTDSQVPKMIKCIMKFEKGIEYRVYDEFNLHDIKLEADGSLLVTAFFPDDEWLYGYLMTFGSNLEVIEPISLRHELIKRLKNTLEKYS